MDIIVVLEQRFERTPDGKGWSLTQFGYPFWRRYLDTFDRVRVVARARDVDTVQAGSRPVEGEGVALAAMPFYVGPWQYVRRFFELKRAASLREAAEDLFWVLLNSREFAFNH